MKRRDGEARAWEGAAGTFQMGMNDNGGMARFSVSQGKVPHDAPRLSTKRHPSTHVEFAEVKTYESTAWPSE